MTLSSPRSLCRPIGPAAVPPRASASGGAAASPFTLVDEARQRGVSFVQTNFATEMKYPFETLGGAVAALDFDDDGWVDLLFLNGAPSPEHVRTDPASFNRLFRNTGEGRVRRRDRSSRG